MVNWNIKVAKKTENSGTTDTKVANWNMKVAKKPEKSGIADTKSGKTETKKWEYKDCTNFKVANQTQQSVQVLDDVSECYTSMARRLSRTTSLMLATCSELKTQT